MKKNHGALIYNLFPLLAGSFEKWTAHLARAAKMGFDWIYLNPLHYPGFSGSLYSVKNYYQINPQFLNPKSSKDEFGQLKKVIASAKKLGLKMMMDLVINHTAIDSVLVAEHPDWYRRDEKGRIKNPSCMDPADARKITVWGDLAEIDNFDSADRKNLWAYWEKLCLFYAELGFRGYRADAAYQVPPELWQRLIKKIKRIYPDFIFVAETLGSKEKDLSILAEVGFDYIYNSSKWWDFRADWCLRQLAASRPLVGSISFAETHDTGRLAAEASSPAYLKMRHLFAAIFSKGLLMPIGFEFGFKRRLNVVKTRPHWWEPANFNITDFIRQVNQFKKRYQIFNEDNAVYFLECLANSQVAGLIKISNNLSEKVIILINIDMNHPRKIVLKNLKEIFQAAGPFYLISPEEKTFPINDFFEAELKPSEIKIIYYKKGTDTN